MGTYVILLSIVMLAGVISLLVSVLGWLPGIPLSKDPAQYVVTSINFLITTNQARYVIDLENLGRNLIRDLSITYPHYTKADKGKLDSHRRNWEILFVAWWMLTFSAFFGTLRILSAAFWGAAAAAAAAAATATWELRLFQFLDFFILTLMSGGYTGLMVFAWRAWHPSKWGAKAIPDL